MISKVEGLIVLLKESISFLTSSLYQHNTKSKTKLWYKSHFDISKIKSLKEQRFTLQEIKSKLFGKSDVSADIIKRYKSTFEKLAD